MATLARRAQRSTNIWPGFVDALATLLMVIIFLLMVFVLAQFFLNEAISGRDTALQKLQSQVNELAELLSLGRKENEALRLNVAQLSDELQASIARQDDLRASVEALTERAAGAEDKVQHLSAQLEEATATVAADKETIQVQLRQLDALTQDVAALKALKEELEAEAKRLLARVQQSEGALAKESERAAEKEKLLVEERELSKSARAQLALVNQQMAALREQLARLSAALDASEELAKKQKVQIASLGKRLNAALASKVQELSRYRSEFFGRLREVLGKQAGIRIVGDRFVFQSEILFESGSADLGTEGQAQIAQLAATLSEISAKIPKDINWILRVDGHTDAVPINTSRFPSNWELSAARAISVVRFLIDHSIPANRLAATGFGEYQPLDTRGDEIANRRNRRIEFKLTQP